MLDNIYYAAFSIVFFIGVVAVLYVLLMRVIRPRKGEMNYIVTVFGAEEKNAVARISYLLTRVSMSGDRQFTRIIAVDNGMTEEQYSALLSAFSTEPCVTLCPRRSLENALFGDK